jgi:hypothetical protein
MSRRDFAAAEIAARNKNVGIITIKWHDRTPPSPTAGSPTQISAAAKGFYDSGLRARQPRHGYVVAQDRRNVQRGRGVAEAGRAGINVKIAAISEELFDASRTPIGSRAAG